MTLYLSKYRSQNYASRGQIYTPGLKYGLRSLFDIDSREIPSALSKNIVRKLNGNNILEDAVSVYFIFLKIP